MIAFFLTNPSKMIENFEILLFIEKIFKIFFFNYKINILLEKKEKKS